MRSEDKYVFVVTERDFAVRFHGLTWQQALIERSRLSWQYNDLLPLDMRDCDHVSPMVEANSRIERE